MLWTDIIGQEQVKQRLAATVDSGKMPHAILLHGQEGVGKMPLAIALAQYLNCRHREGGHACGRCPSCQQMAKMAHPDVHFVFPIVKKDSASSTFCDDFIETFRNFALARNGYFTFGEWADELKSENKQPTIYTSEGGEIIRKLSLTAFESEYKIMIIWQAERMQVECANKLLKTLEEPTAKTVFILVSEHPEMMLTTILSRTQHIFVPNLADDQLRTSLREMLPSVDAETENELIRIAGGSLTALKANIAKSEADDRNFSRFVTLMRAAYMRDVLALRTLTEEICKDSRPEQRLFLQYAQRMVRESFMFNFHERQLNYMMPKESAFCVKFSPFINERNIYGIMDELSLAERHITQNVSGKMVFFDLAMKIMLLIRK